MKSICFSQLMKNNSAGNVVSFLWLRMDASFGGLLASNSLCLVFLNNVFGCMEM
jgi:hypothetical protein